MAGESKSAEGKIENVITTSRTSLGYRQSLTALAKLMHNR